MVQHLQNLNRATKRAYSQEPQDFMLKSDFSPTGDQPEAIKTLIQGLDNGESHQTLLGVTGSGKTFTMANVIAQTNRPALILAHNKTLAAQLYGEFKSFFPDNAVEYFVSYYDYYQPEAYVAASDTYIKKDANVNEHIEQMRLSATKSLLERQDVIIVATVSSIYGLGEPESYMQMLLHLTRGEQTNERAVAQRLVSMQYGRTPYDLDRGQFRVRGEHIDIFPAESAGEAIRVTLFDGEVESIHAIDPITGKSIRTLARVSIYPKSHYVTPRQTVLDAVKYVEAELKERLKFFIENNKLVEAQRLEERTRYDIEMMLELGYCSGIENYSRYLSKGREAGSPPATLYDYLPDNAIIFVDESHASIPQLGAMYKGDRSRKENLVNYGFRLPSALDNRPLRFHEWEERIGELIMVSATPSAYEKEHCEQFVEQLLRPTGIIDPEIIIRPARTQIDDLFEVVQEDVAKGNRILVTVLTKKLAENLTEYLSERGIRVSYLHSDIDTVERTEIIRSLRLGNEDVLVGINLLREGLDMPEVRTVCILDADKEGFLRSTRSLIQTIGRAARHIEGRAILYADRETNSMRESMAESARRREIQLAYNKQHNITPHALKKRVDDIMDAAYRTDPNKQQQGKAKSTLITPKEFKKRQHASQLALDMQTDISSLTPQDKLDLIKRLRVGMKVAADALEFEQAAEIKAKLMPLL